MKCRIILCFVAFQCLIFTTSSEEQQLPITDIGCTDPPTETTEIVDCSAPCPESGNGFCYFMKDYSTCQCQEVCCSLRECEGSDIDWDNCHSCSDDCQCLPIVTEPPPTETTEIVDCSAPCPESRNGFCYFMKDYSTCQCQEVCCYPYCPDGETIDWDNCNSCTDCQCLPLVTEPPPTETTEIVDCSAPCPEPSSNFCSSYRNPDSNCQCQEVCCWQNLCPDSPINWDDCHSCSNCSCLDIATTTETMEPSTITFTTTKQCPIQECPPSDFCYGERDEHCLCEYFCCYPYCPDGETIDWDHCYSCDNCTCLVDQIPTPEPCAITCEDRPDCRTEIDYESCQCTYDCTTIRPTPEPCAITCEDRLGCKSSVNYDSCQCEYDCSPKQTRRRKLKCFTTD